MHSSGFTGEKAKMSQQIRSNAAHLTEYDFFTAESCKSACRRAADRESIPGNSRTY
jgi:hypothetical protein